MLRPARLATLSRVAANPEITSSGSTPPRNCSPANTGSPVSTSSIRLSRRAASLLRTISRFSQVGGQQELQRLPLLLLGDGAGDVSRRDQR